MSAPSDASAPARLDVLIVEDDRTIARAVERLLRTGGFRAAILHHPRLVVDTVLARRPRVVLLDVMLPDMDGASVAKAIRAERRAVGTRIVLFSALPEDQLARAAVHCGADAFLAKGVAITQLRELMRFWCAPTDDEAVSETGMVRPVRSPNGNGLN